MQYRTRILWSSSLHEFLCLWHHILFRTHLSLSDHIGLWSKCSYRVRFCAMVVARTPLFTMIWLLILINIQNLLCSNYNHKKTNTFFFCYFVIQKRFCSIFSLTFLGLADNYYYYLFRLFYVLFIHLSFLSIFHSFTSFSTATLNLREIPKIWTPRFVQIVRSACWYI